MVGAEAIRNRGMIIQLISDDIVTYWEKIKYAAIKANEIEDIKVETYLQNLLLNLLSNKCQAWFVLSETNDIKTILITRIYNDIFNAQHIFIDVAFGYNPTNEEEKAEYIEHLTKFAKNKNITGKEAIIAFTSNPVAMNAMRKMGMQESYRIFTKEVRNG